jgi:ABC-type branched-subunit amino acid transport system ATPase component
MSESVIATLGLSKSFGALRVIDDVNFKLARGARQALIGPNGAGKTTLVNLLAGTLRPSAGSILLEGKDVTRLRPDQRVKRGLARTFQVSCLFPRLTPLEAVTLAVCERMGVSAKLQARFSKQSAAVGEAYDLLVSIGLGADCCRPTQELSYGRQRLLEIALALAAEPQALVLDEPAAGVPKAQSAQLFEALAALPRRVSVLFIEHDMDLVFRFAERITVLTAGKILVEGSAESIASSVEVREIYLGRATHV